MKKSTTLRDLFKEKFKKVFILHDKQDHRYTYLVEDVTDDVIDFFLAHNTELISKIEGILSEVVIENEDLTQRGYVIDETVQKIRTKFRSLINQNK